ncbi:MAG: AAA family ATPase [bacterium]
MEELRFGDFRFDALSLMLWHRGEAVALTPKASAVLNCLVAARGRLVSKDELLDAVWPDTAVSDASLKVCVREIRRALGDAVSAPRYIATVHRRGYRFVAAIDAASAATPSAPPAEATLVGRAAPLAALRAALARAEGGARQTIFITGDIGLGKTTLLDAWLAEAAAHGAAVARGRCVAAYGASEAYLPVLDALERLRRGPRREALLALLRERAPTWLAQLAWLVPEGERAALQRDILGGTRERMLREITEALEAFATTTPLVLAIEDLHWSDPSTLDVLARLSQRQEAARLLVIGTYRPVDAILSDHPVKGLKQRLAEQRFGAELSLDPLEVDDIAAYLAARIDGAPPPQLAEALHARTDGNPLFVVTAVDALLAGGDLVHDAGGWSLGIAPGELAARVPEGLRLMVEHHVERFAPSDATLLEAAALARGEFSAALVAAALAVDPLAVEARCEHLARAGLGLRAAGSEELPDGTASGRYRFTHELYRDVLAARIPAARRARLHLRIGEWLERAHGGALNRGAVTAALAHHFHAAREAPRAIRYLAAAARIAAARHAAREAIDALTRALALTDALPVDAQPGARVALLQQRGNVHRATGDFEAAVTDLGDAAASARAHGDVAQEVYAMLGVAAAWSLRDRARCLSVAEATVERSVAGGATLHAHARAFFAYWSVRIRGWQNDDGAAVAHALAGARAVGTPGLIAPLLGIESYILNLRADYAGALRAATEGGHLTEATGGDPITHLLCQYQRCWAMLHAGEWSPMLATLAGATRMAARNGNQPWALVLELLVAWTLDEAGDSTRALARGRVALAAAQQTVHEFGIVLGGVVTGRAAVASAEPAAAGAAFAIVRDVVHRQPAAMEWILRLPLHLGLSDAALAAGDAAAAAREAGAVSALAAQAGERTYQALALVAQARAALLSGDGARAAEALDAARGGLVGGDAPLAAWRIEAAAADWHAVSGRPRQAAAAQRRATTLRTALRAALDEVDAATAATLRLR